MAFLITTTGTQDPVVFDDLGARSFAHPTVDYDLQTEYGLDEINDSIDVAAAITAGYITVKDENGNDISDPSVLEPLNQQQIGVPSGIAGLDATGLVPIAQLPTGLPPGDHASNHTDGTDDIQDATAAQKGLATAAQITKLDAISGTNTGDEPDATTTTKGVVELATDGESAANVVVQGNDARLSDARTPTSHSTSHENGGGDEISVAGLSGLLADNQNPTAHASEHTDGTDDIQNATAAQKGLATAAQITKLDAITGTNTGDEPDATATTKGIVELATDGESGANVVVQGNDARLSDARTPTSHASSHQSAGGDAIKLDDLAAPDDNTDLDASTSAHGLMKKYPGGTTNFLRADGTFAAPPGSGSDLEVEDEGVSLSTAATKINFAGAGVTATEPVADEILVTIPGGDAVQSSTVTTTDATPTEIDKIDDLTNNSIHLIDIRCACKNTPVSEGGIWVLILGVIVNSGVPTIILSDFISHMSTSGLNANSLTFTVNGSDIDIDVTGIAATSIKWDLNYKLSLVTT